MNIITVKNACKSFNGNAILKNLNLEIQQGKIVGLIGQNGSGKTVLMKSICGFLTLDKGEIYVNGKRVGIEVDIPHNLGIIIEAPGFLPNFSGLSNLKQLASIRKKVEIEKIELAMERVGLSPKEKKHVAKYSLGMRQKLGIAQAIMENPDVLILDEPMNGLDESSIIKIRDLLFELKKEGKTILISSHNYEDLDTLSDEIYEMNKGIVTRVHSIC